ncbi:DnaJ C-terminal domain-containing protein [Aquibaculum sediminis]|uniref:DnaJ C-terminal domain-containing protein n=1 Tax=Aquibaculum sediminis TaxID=3231907 RepID=UPI0034563FDD
MKDLYSVLGVAKSAKADEIKAAYRRLAKKLHPDLNPGDTKVEQQFKDVSHAYAILSDPEKRRRYDAGEIDASGQETARGGFYRSAHGRGGEKYAHYETAGGGFEDIFSDLFGGGFGARGSGGPKQKGADVSYSLKVSFTDAASGARKRVQIGDGRTLDLTIPPGTEDGQTLRLKGQGLPGFGGAPAGDAYVEVKVEPHAFFGREGKNLHLELPISLAEAVLGGTVQVPTLAGKVAMKVPPGSNSGNTLRLKGKGVPDRRGGEPGDLYVTLRVVLPEKPDAELQAFAKDWATRHNYNPRAKAGMD